MTEPAGTSGLATVLFATAFSRQARAAGLPSAPDRSVRFARALAMAPPADRDALYWTARTVFVSSPEDIPLLDAMFERTEPDMPVEMPLRPGAFRGRGVDGLLSPASPGAEPAAGPALVVASPAERELADKDFAALDEGEQAAVRRMMADLRLATPLRRTRRAARGRRGRRTDLRATLHQTARHGGDPWPLVRRRRRRVPRRLIVLCDVSGSMAAYSRMFLQFLHVAVSAAQAEAFVFATRLTRLTHALGGPDADAAIAAAAAATPDWSSGTQIGEALRRFNIEHGGPGLAHGAVVVIVSDGWEFGPPEMIGREMEHLRRLAHRIVWVNPRKALPGFVPRGGGMAAALPHCDAFLAGNSLQSLHEVIDAIADASRSA